MEGTKGNTTVSHCRNMDTELMPTIYSLSLYPLPGGEQLGRGAAEVLSEDVLKVLTVDEQRLRGSDSKMTREHHRQHRAAKQWPGQERP